MASIKKTKTIGKASESFMRELDQSEFILDEERQQDLKFIQGQPNRGQKILQYFIRTGLKYKEVFDALHIGDLAISEQLRHRDRIVDLLRDFGWQGKVDLHTRPMGPIDHPSPHFHLWGSQVTKEVYDLVKNYLIENGLTNVDRLKKMKSEKRIEKLSREELNAAKNLAPKESAGPAELPVIRKPRGVDERLKAFVDKVGEIDPKTVAAVERFAQKQSSLGEKINALKQSMSNTGEALPVVRSASRKAAIDNKFEESVKTLTDRLNRLKTDLSTNG